VRQETPRKTASLSRATKALVALAAAIALAAAAVSLHRHAEDRRHLRTGAAEWIWWARASRTPAPVRFYAFRDVALANVPSRARALVGIDPAGALSVNGTAVTAPAWRAGEPLRAVDLVPLLRPGSNRIAVEASSPDGVGGILFAAEGDGLDPAAFASGRAWRVARDADAAGRGEVREPIVWGRPPQFPWGYPQPLAGEAGTD